MLIDLYRDIAIYLMPKIVSSNLDPSNAAVRELPRQLLDALHTLFYKCGRYMRQSRPDSQSLRRIMIAWL